MSGESGRFDIAIVGGGLIGASLVCALAPMGYRIALLESISRQADSQPSFDDRTLALSRASCRILEGIGVWNHLEADATAIRQIVVTELGRPGRVVLDPAEMGLAAFGHVVEARRFGRALMQRMGELPGVEVLCPVTVTGLEQGDEAVRVAYDSEGQAGSVETSLLVAADGARSTVRDLLGISCHERDYRQTAVICNIVPERHHDGRAFERLTPTGPFAVLPHAGERCGLVWTVATAGAEELVQLGDDAFLARASARFGGELGAFVKVGRRSAYPLRLVRAHRDIDRRVVILGNAAHAIHPVGAQGFNLGCRDVAALAEVLAAGHLADPGSEAALAEYSRWRRSDHDATIGLSDGLARLFAQGFWPLSALRSLGMYAHALSPTLRRRLASGAMGFRGRIPRLALGQSLEDLGR